MTNSLDSDISAIIKYLLVEFMDGAKVKINLMDGVRGNNKEVYNGQKMVVSLFSNQSGDDPS